MPVSHQDVFAIRGFANSFSFEQLAFLETVISNPEKKSVFQEQVEFNRGYNDEVLSSEHAALFFGLKYALGRASASVSFVSSALSEEWPNLSNTFKERVHEMIEIAIQADRAGMSCDIAEWQKILDLPVYGNSPSI